MSRKMSRDSTKDVTGLHGDFTGVCEEIFGDFKFMEISRDFTGDFTDILRDTQEISQEISQQI